MSVSKGVRPWVVGTIGALVVALTTAIGSVASDSIEEKRRETEREIVETEAMSQRQHLRHTQTYDITSPTADLFWALSHATESTDAKKLLIDRAARSLGDGINVMMQMSNKYDYEADYDAILKLSVDVEELKKELQGKKGQKAYEKLRTLFGDWEMASRMEMDRLNGEIVEKRMRYEALRSKHDSIRVTQATFTLIGLVILLLNDIPIWRASE